MKITLTKTSDSQLVLFKDPSKLPELEDLWDASSNEYRPDTYPGAAVGAWISKNDILCRFSSKAEDTTFLSPGQTIKVLEFSHCTAMVANKVTHMATLAGYITIDAWEMV